MSKSIYYSIAATAAVLLSACSGDVTEVTEINEVGMKVIEKGEALPSCSSDNEGAMVYAVDSAAAYFCVNRKWTSMKGEKGDQGEPGKDGKQGKQGEQGDKGDKGDPGEQGEQGEKGDQGEKGEDGSSCTAELLSDSSGYKVVCNGDSIGVVLNGADGEKGDKGDQGEQGNKGDAGPKGDTGVGCSLLDDGNGSVKVTCGEGKSATTTTLYKAVCGNVPYDPETIAPLYCDNGSFYMKDSRDNQIYRVVIIGSQTWMAENLNYAYLQPTEELDSSSFCYDNLPENCEKYGRLYLWSAVMDSAGIFSDEGIGCGCRKMCKSESKRGVCPDGWHVASLGEFLTLFATVGDNLPSKLKSRDIWPDNSNTDDYGFSILPAGSGKTYSNISFSSLGTYFTFWTSSSDGDNAEELSSHNAAGAIDGSFYRFTTDALWEIRPIRCIKD